MLRDDSVGHQRVASDVPALREGRLSGRGRLACSGLSMLDGISPGSNTPDLGEGAAVVSLGAVDIGEEVLVGVQVDCGIERGKRQRETEEGQTRRDGQRTLKYTSWMA